MKTEKELLKEAFMEGWKQRVEKLNHTYGTASRIEASNRFRHWYNKLNNK
jgi:hypothetical protein